MGIVTFKVVWRHSAHPLCFFL